MRQKSPFIYCFWNNFCTKYRFFNLFSLFVWFTYFYIKWLLRYLHIWSLNFAQNLSGVLWNDVIKLIRSMEKLLFSLSCTYAVTMNNERSYLLFIDSKNDNFYNIKNCNLEFYSKCLTLKKNQFAKINTIPQLLLLSIGIDNHYQKSVYIDTIITYIAWPINPIYILYII